MPFLPTLRERASLLDVFKAFPKTARPLLYYHEELLRGPSPFSEAERELIAAYVSGLNGCGYCRGVHAATAERLGVPPGAVEQMLECIDFAPISTRMRPVLRYAEKLTRDPASVDREDALAILAAGWGETAVYHVAAVTGLFNLMNRLVQGLGIELDPEYVPLAAGRLAARGYLALLDVLPP